MKLIILVIIFIFSILGKIAHYFLFSETAIKRKLKSNKGAKIIDIKHDKKIQTKGRIISREKIISTPVTGKECVWFKLEVFFWNAGWQLLSDEIEMSNFEIEDETGKTKIIAGYMQIATESSKSENENISITQMKSVLDFLTKKGQISAPLLTSNSKLKFKEKWLPLDSNIIVKGKGQIKNGDSSIKGDHIDSMYISKIE